MIENIATDSFIIPIYEPTNISYVRNAHETGMEMHFVSLGLSIHSDTVTNADAVTGRISYHASKERTPSVRFVIIKITGQKARLANLYRLRFINTSSRNIPTKFGITPAKAPKHILMRIFSVPLFCYALEIGPVTHFVAHQLRHFCKLHPRAIRNFKGSRYNYFTKIKEDNFKRQIGEMMKIIKNYPDTFASFEKVNEIFGNFKRNI